MLYSDPIAQVMIVDANSKEAWVLTDPSSPWATGVKLEYGVNAVIASITVDIDIPYDFVVNNAVLDNDKSLLRFGNKVRARIGYATGEWTPWAYGVLTQGGTGVTITPDGLSGTLNIQTTSVKTLGYTVDKILLDNFGGDALALVNKIGEALKYTVEMSDDTKTVLNSTWNPVLSKLNTDAKGVEEQKQKNIQFIASLANKSYGDAFVEFLGYSLLDYFVEQKDGKNILHICRKGEIEDGKYTDSSKPRRKYVLRGILDDSAGQYPIWTFSPETGESPASDTYSWSGKTAPSAGVDAAGIDKEKGELVKFAYSENSEDIKAVGKSDTTKPQDVSVEGIFADIAKQDGKLGTFMSAPVFSGGQKAFEQQAKLFGLMGNPGLIATMTTIGIPKAKVGDIIEVWGCGEIYNGVYRVDSLIHSWTPGAWEMTLKLSRRGKKDYLGRAPEPKAGQMK